MIENVIIAPVTNSTAPNRGKGGELLLAGEREERVLKRSLENIVCSYLQFQFDTQEKETNSHFIYRFANAL